MRRSSGFTLIELMLVVAIVGLLAAIGIPTFLEYTLKTKSGEASLNLSAIRTAELQYQASNDNFEPCPTTPAGAPSSGQRLQFLDPTGCYQKIGFFTEIPVYFQYQIDTDATNSAFAAAAQADLDGNSVMQIWALDHALGAVSVPLPFVGAPVGTGHAYDLYRYTPASVY